MILSSLDYLLGELSSEFGLSAEDAEAIRVQAFRMREVVDQLDELPLERVEPAAIFKVVP